MDSPDYRSARYDGGDDAWNAFVRAHPDGRFCHLTGFQEAMRRTYRLAGRRFALWRGNELAGVLPVSVARSLLFGKKWVSMPFGEYGGFLLNPDVPADTATAFATLVVDAARMNGAGVLELNGLLGLPEGAQSAFNAAVPYEAAVLDLTPGPDALLNKVFKYEVRKALKKGQAAGITCHEASDIDTLKNRFYPMFLQSMRRLGVPPHGSDFFENLKTAFGKDLQIHWAEREGKILAGLLGIRCGPRVQITTTVSSPEGWEHRPNDMLHWAYIQAACAEGATLFDFGSVRYEGQRHYKTKFGVVFTPAAHWIASFGSDAAKKTFNSSSDTMTKASALWQKYVPESVGAVIGPMIRRQLLR